MRKRRILIPAVTVADWGGLHEWVAEATGWLVQAGHSVTVVGSGDRFSDAVLRAGADLIPVGDWKEWSQDLDFVVGAGQAQPYDLIFAHGPQARALGMAASLRLGSPLYVMVHGAYHDYAFEWAENAHRFITASPSLADFMVGVAKIDRSMVRVVPNGLPRGVESLPLTSLADKLSGGRAHVVTASRLDHDKVAQIPIAKEVMSTCAAVYPGVHWQLDVYGDGRLRAYFHRELHQHVSGLTNASVKFHGWIPPEEVPSRMNESVVGIVAGLGGMRSIAAGVLCVAVGARDMVGVQYGDNLAKGIYSNFGDHGTQGYAPTPITSDLRRLLGDQSAYDSAVAAAREISVGLRSRDIVREKLLLALDLH